MIFMKRKSCFLALVLLLCVFVGCSTKKSIDSSSQLNSDASEWGQLESFTYKYGSYHSGYWEYEISDVNGDLYLTAKGMNGVELNVHKKLNLEDIEKLTSIVVEQNLSSLDGYQKSDDGVLDGYSFFLDIQYQNHSITCSAYHKVPANYAEWHDVLVTYLEKISK